MEVGTIETSGLPPGLSGTCTTAVSGGPSGPIGHSGVADRTVDWPCADQAHPRRLQVALMTPVAVAAVPVARTPFCR